MRLRRIIVLKVDHIGDFILAGRAFADLRRACSNRHLTLVCGSPTRPLADGLGIFDEVITFDFYPTGVDAPGSNRQVEYASIRDHVSGAYDLAIDLRHDPDTRPLLDHINAKIRVGFDGGELARPLDLSLPRFDERPSLSSQRFVLHAETRMRLLTTAVIDTFFSHAEPMQPPLARPGRVKRIAGDYFVIAPGSGVRLKNWSARNFAVVAGRLVTKLGFKAVLVGGLAEEEAARSIAIELPAAVCINLVGRLSLTELQDVVGDARLFVGNSSGPTHMAAWLGVPTVCIFSGRADPMIWRPRGPQVRIVQAVQPCAPCHLSYESQCAFGVACLRDITPRIVMDACKKVLKSRRRHSKRPKTSRPNPPVASRGNDRDKQLDRRASRSRPPRSWTLE
jgi:ADP-heptose:LPS heptosyltransferase